MVAGTRRQTTPLCPSNFPGDLEMRTIGRNPVSNVLLALLIALVALLLVQSIWTFGPALFTRNGAQPRPITPRGNLADDEKSTIELFRGASASVVYITTQVVRRDSFTLNLQEIPRGAGSGIVWDERGHVITNFHVIRNVDRAQVTLSDNTTWDAVLVGSSPEEDLAVLRINSRPSQLTPMPIGTSHDLEVGQKVFAIGNPFGLDRSLTTGVISGLGRQIKSLTGHPIEGAIQTDAAINPGNSGGPLLDSAGRLIGMNTAIVSPSGVYAGVGFAVPVDTINQTVPELIANGRVVRPGLGVTIAQPHITRQLGIEGALVLTVREGSAAEKAGIRPTVFARNRRIRLGDVIVAVNDDTVTGLKTLVSALRKHKVGDKVTVTVEREDEKHDLEVRLQALRPRL